MVLEEDHVSFDLAKLLKEKGFDVDIDNWYDKDGESFFCYHYDISNNWRVKIGQKVYLCPTLQMACKWLRVKHNLNVEVYRTACGYIGCIVAIPSGTDIKFLETDGNDKASDQYTKPELVTEDAIKYCLEHLI